jgi:hypothetical protein
MPEVFVAKVSQFPGAERLKSFAVLRRGENTYVIAG